MIGFGADSVQASMRWGGLVTRRPFALENTGSRDVIGVDVVVPTDQGFAKDLAGLKTDLAVFEKKKSAWRHRNGRAEQGRADAEGVHLGGT